ncbi:MAG: lysylphosphatidylglycerol synthase domain-containing protein [Vicinamibacterales bacterium]
MVIRLLTAVFGAALLAFTIRQVGWSAVVTGIASVGWAFLLVVALGAVRMVFRARAWVVCAEQSGGAGPEAALPFSAAFGAMLAADALGNLTPLGLLASEPAKVMMARTRVSTVTSIASVTIENAFYTLSVATVLLSGTWLFFQRASVPPTLEYFAEAIVAGAVIGGIAFLWAARTQPAVLSRLAPIITRLAGKADAPAAALREVEARIYGVLQWPVARLARVGIWEVAFHVAAVTEVFVVLRLLPGGAGTTLVDAFLMESAGRFVTVAFKFIPYRLGVDEAGSGAVAQMLGYGPVTGVTLALIRRIRILFLNVFGLIQLARSS